MTIRLFALLSMLASLVGCVQEASEKPAPTPSCQEALCEPDPGIGGVLEVTLQATNHPDVVVEGKGIYVVPSVDT